MNTASLQYSSPSNLFGNLQPTQQSIDAEIGKRLTPSPNILAEIEKVRDGGGDDELGLDIHVVGHPQMFNGKLIDFCQIWYILSVGLSDFLTNT